MRLMSWPGHAGHSIFRTLSGRFRPYKPQQVINPFKGKPTKGGALCLEGPISMKG